MDQERVARMRAAMATRRLDALVLRLPENLTLLAGYYPLTGMNFLLFSRDNDPVLIVPASEVDESSVAWWKDIRTFEFGTLAAGDPLKTIGKLLKAAVRQKKGSWKRVGYEGRFESFAPALLTGECSCPAEPTREMIRRSMGDARLCDCSELLHRERAVKTSTELAGIGSAAHLADIGLAEFRRVAGPGRTGAEIAGLVTAAIVRQEHRPGGPSRVQAFPQVSTGAEETSRGWRACVVSTSRPIREGDLALLELGVVADGLWADVTRTVVAGAPLPRQEEVFGTVCRAQRAAIAAVREGVSCREVDAAARTVIEKAGLGEYFFHVTGHGIGFRYHEPFPLLHPAEESALRCGMVFSVEPGVYIPGFGGIRTEDMVALTPEGAAELTSASRELIGGS